MLSIPQNIDYPSWYPGKALTAEDFYSFERYVFSQRKHHSPDTGISSMIISPEQSPSVIASINDDGFLSLQVQHISGLTPSGHPVEIGHKELRATLPLSNADRHIFDLAIEINSTGPTSDSHVEPGKYSLLAYLSQDHKEGYKLTAQVLYLGRFSFRSTTDSGIVHSELDLIKYPPLIKLSSLVLSKNDWLKWTSPLTKKLNATLQSLQGRDKELFSYAHTVALNETYQIIFNWHTFPISVLLEHLRYLNWLLEFSKHQSEIKAEEIPFTKRESFNFFTEIRELPSRLSNVIGNSIVQVPERRDLLPDAHYRLQWIEEALHIELLRNFTDSKYRLQVQLDFGENNDHDCRPYIRTSIESQDLELTPEITFNQIRHNCVTYSMEMYRPLDKHTLIKLLALSEKQPKVSIKYYKEGT